jgi:Inner membrane protein YgaP-like, transmembrane domain
MTFPNESGWDRGVRVAVGLALLVLGWSGEVSGWWGIGVKLFALFPLASGLLGWDPFYAMLGFSTRRR